MSTRKAPNINNYFSSAQKELQLSEAEAEIQRLRNEIEELRAQGSTELEAPITELREQLQSNAGILAIPLAQIEPNPEQPRQTFLAESIDSMARSLKSDGQLEPIILIQRENLVIFDGERRWRSAKALGWETLQAVIIPEPVALHRQALLTSLHREDLNPLDKAEAIVRELADQADLDASSIPRILSTVVRRLNKQGRMEQLVGLMTAVEQEQLEGLAALGLEEREQTVLALLLDLQLHPASIDANVFPMLALAVDLKTAIRTNGLKGVHAMCLQKLSAKNLGKTEAEAQSIRVEATQQVINEKLSVKETRKLVSDLISNQVVSSSKETPAVRQVLKATETLQKLSGEILSKNEPEKLKEFQKLLRQKLAEVKEVLQQK